MTQQWLIDVFPFIICLLGGEMMSQNFSKLADRLKNLRYEKGLSQYELADKLGVSRGLIGNYEQGRREPDYNTLILFANFYDVSLDYLLGITDIRKRVLHQETEDTYKKMFREITDLSPKSQEELEHYIELLRIRDTVEDEKDSTSSALEKES